MFIKLDWLGQVSLWYTRFGLIQLECYLKVRKKSQFVSDIMLIGCNVYKSKKAYKTVPARITLDFFRERS